jgi:hypothetical protein
MTAALDGLRALGHPRDTFTDSVVFWLLDNAQPDGFWEHTTNRTDRPPSEGSPFTATTMSLLGLIHYGRETTRSNEVHLKILAGLEWLRHAPVQATEDLVQKLVALREARVFFPDGSLEPEIESTVNQLKREQNSNGGWGIRAGAPSDVYSSSTVLLALKPELDRNFIPQSQYQEGLTFLVRAQRTDGSFPWQTMATHLMQMTADTRGGIRVIGIEPGAHTLSQQRLRGVHQVQQRFSQFAGADDETRSSLLRFRRTLRPSDSDYENVKNHLLLHSMFFQPHVVSVALQALSGPQIRPSSITVGIHPSCLEILRQIGRH